METSVATVPDDRLTVSCPPETFEYGSESTNFLSSTPNGDAFVRQYPERPGETDYDLRSHTESQGGCSTVIEEDDEASNEEHEADKFGFFVTSNTSVAAIQRPLDLDKLRRREKKWIQMFENWRFFMDNKFDKVRDRCRKGIPPSIRGKAWKYLCGAIYHMDVSNNKHVFEACTRGVPEQRWVDDIEKDLNRQFPEHEMFARSGKFGENGREDLATLLKAWTVLFPDEGYCQGQAPVASVLLMHMPVRDAFYCFVPICVRYLPNYYSAGLEAVQIDGDILTCLLKDKCYVTYKHFKKNGVDPVLYMVEWFMCIFCRTLPWPTVLRVWDMFFCEGVKVLFKVAIVLLKYSLGTKEQCKQYPDLHAIVMRLKNLPPQIVEEEFLVQKVCEMNLDEGEMEKLHFRAMKLRQMRIKQK